MCLHVGPDWMKTCSSGRLKDVWKKKKVCKEQLKIAYNERGSASKSFSAVHQENHLYLSSDSQVLSAVVPQEQQIQRTELGLSLLE